MEIFAQSKSSQCDVLVDLMDRLLQTNLKSDTTSDEEQKRARIVTIISAAIRRLKGSSFDRKKMEQMLPHAVSFVKVSNPAVTNTSVNVVCSIVDMLQICTVTDDKNLSTPSHEIVSAMRTLLHELFSKNDKKLPLKAFQRLLHEHSDVMWELRDDLITYIQPNTSRPFLQSQAVHLLCLCLRHWVHKGSEEQKNLNDLLCQLQTWALEAVRNQAEQTPNHTFLHELLLLLNFLAHTSSGKVFWTQDLVNCLEKLFPKLHKKQKNQCFEVLKPLSSQWSVPLEKLKESLKRQTGTVQNDVKSKTETENDSSDSGKDSKRQDKQNTSKKVKKSRSDKRKCEKGDTTDKSSEVKSNETGKAEENTDGANKKDKIKSEKHSLKSKKRKLVDDSKLPTKLGKGEFQHTKNTD